MHKAYYSAVLNSRVDHVWNLVRDFNDYRNTSRVSAKAGSKMAGTAMKSVRCGGFATAASGYASV
jgi:hypothetical protein